LRIPFIAFLLEINKKGHGIFSTAYKIKKPWAVKRSAHGVCLMSGHERGRQTSLKKLKKAKN
jgi:hypothetical protein